MLKSKHLFDYDPDKAREMRAIYGSSTNEERAMQTHRQRGRRTLTASDHQHNRNVHKLFNNIIPGLPIDADPPEIRREPDCMQSLIENTMKKLNIEVHDWIEELRAAWKDILPPEITDKTQPGKYANNTLFVYVRSSVELFELRRVKLKQIERAVRQFAPDKNIRHVRLMVNHSPL